MTAIRRTSGAGPRLSLIAPLLLALTVNTAQAAPVGEGLNLRADSAAHWQARIHSPGNLGKALPALNTLSALGDYYFRPYALGPGNTNGGFRATSGLLTAHGTEWPQAFDTAMRSNGRIVNLHASALPASPSENLIESHSTRPYLGLGYSRLGAQGDWGFTADLGVVARSTADWQGPSNGLLGPARMDDAWRNLRLTPLLKLGMRYSF